MIEKKNIYVYHTHIEVSPYKEGECLPIEKMHSKYEPNEYKYIPISFYISKNVLYLPRGTNLSLLEKYFLSTPVPVAKCDPYLRMKTREGVSLYPPKSERQAEAIKFLCAEDEYTYTGRYSQLGLNLDTGDGKTYAAVTAILKLRFVTIIILHQEKIKKQWYDTFHKMTTIPIKNVYDISGSEGIDAIINGTVKKDIYLVLHQTLHAYARIHGWEKIREFFKKANIGLKVIDESHKFFSNTFMIDNFSDCYKTFYLTATFGRTDTTEKRLYQRAFSSLVRFGEDTVQFTEKRKHINFIVCYFKSTPKYGIQPNVQTGYGFSSYKYIDYELQEQNNTLLRIMDEILFKTSKLTGITLILSPKQVTCDIIKEWIERHYTDSVGTIYSKNKHEVNELNKTKRYISSTIKSMGEGADIKKLRVQILLEPISSPQLMEQVIGRMREYSEDKETYIFYPVDLTIPDCERMLHNVLPAIKKKCKELIYLNMMV